MYGIYNSCCVFGFTCHFIFVCSTIKYYCYHDPNFVAKECSGSYVVKHHPNLNLSTLLPKSRLNNTPFIYIHRV